MSCFYAQTIRAALRKRMSLPDRESVALIARLTSIGPTWLSDGAPSGRHQTQP